MFNMDVMKQGAEAFGRIADAIERQANALYAQNIHNAIVCPVKDVGASVRACTYIAGHPGLHEWEEDVPSGDTDDNA